MVWAWQAWRHRHGGRRPQEASMMVESRPRGQSAWAIHTFIPLPSRCWDSRHPRIVSQLAILKSEARSPHLAGYTGDQTGQPTGVAAELAHAGYTHRTLSLHCKRSIHIICRSMVSTTVCLRTESHNWREPDEAQPTTSWASHAPLTSMEGGGLGTCPQGVPTEGRTGGS